MKRAKSKRKGKIIYMTESENKNTMQEILIPKEDLILKYIYKTPEKSYAYKNSEDPAAWQNKCRSKLQELVGCDFNGIDKTFEIHRTAKLDFGTVHSLIMRVDETLTLPGYLLVPEKIKHETPVLAVQGHTHDVKGILGIREDYHHGFGKELCRAGFVVLVPETRGFGTLKNLADSSENRRLTYWADPVTFSIVTDAFQKGYTLIGETVQDLFAWASYLCKFSRKEKYSLAGISYGGDMSLILAALDLRANKTFASGTLGSMSTIFDICCNAPAHCVPNILKYMDRQEIASCIAPRSLAVHYGGLDVPSPKNYSASFNETAVPAFNGVKRFYDKMNAEDNIQLIISPDMKHEMDNIALIDYLKDH